MAFGFDEYEDLQDDDELVDVNEDEPRTVTCKRCGVSGLHWEEHPIGIEWVLVEPNDERHVCTADDSGFEKVDL